MHALLLKSAPTRAHSHLHDSFGMTACTHVVERTLSLRLLLQVLLVLAAVLAVPVMLIPKPMVLKKRAAKRAAQLESYGQVGSSMFPDSHAAPLQMHVQHIGSKLVL